MKLKNLTLALSLSLFATIGTAQANIIKAIFLPPLIIANALSTNDWQNPELGNRSIALAFGTTSAAAYSVPYLNVTATSANWMLIELSQIRKVRIAESLQNEIEDYQFTGEASQVLSETLALNNVSEEEKETFLNDLNERLSVFLENN